MPRSTSQSAAAAAAARAAWLLGKDQSSGPGHASNVTVCRVRQGRCSRTKALIRALAA